MILTSDFPPDEGGMARYAGGLARHLAGLFARVIVIVERQGTGGASREAQAPCSVIEVPVGKATFLGRVCRLFRRCWRLVRTEPVRHIFVVSWSPAGVVACLLSFLFPIRYFVAAHGLDILEPQRSLKFRLLMKAVLQRANKVFPVSRFTARRIQALGLPSNRVVVVPCGTEPARFSGSEDGRAIARRYRWSGNRVLLTVGRLVRRKGHDLVIEALQQLISKHPDLVYLIVGEGPEKARLQALVQARGLQGRVAFAGFVPEDELPAYYRLADVFIMPSRSLLRDGDVEGFGIVFLEANVSGKPVIAARSGGIEDAVIDGETGLLVDPDNSLQLAQAVDRLLADPELRRRLGRQGRERVLKELNWNALADRLCAEMVSGNSG